MIFTPRIPLLAAALLLCAALSAQSGLEDMIREDPDRAAGVHHSYEYLPGSETRVRGLEPVSGPYYRWSDFKAHLQRRCAEYSL